MVSFHYTLANGDNGIGGAQAATAVVNNSHQQQQQQSAAQQGTAAGSSTQQRNDPGAAAAAAPGASQDWNPEECDRFSFDDSDRFEEDSLCSWSSEPESLCNNWRGWKKPIANNGFGNNSVRRTSEEEPAVTLAELAAKCVASYIPFELVEHVYPPVPEQLQLRIAFWSFPDNEEDIRLYSCLANSSADEFHRGDLLFKNRAVKDPLQIGFHLSATVVTQQPRSQFNVAVTFDRRRISSCNCTCASSAYWCSHVVAVCLHRIHCPNEVCLRAPVSESLTRLQRDQLQKFAQYLISELPQQILPTAQRLLDELLSAQPTAINTVCGAPDPTAGASANDQTNWYLDEKTLHDNIKRILIKFCLPAPIVFSDVNYLTNSAPPAAAEWSSLLRPLRGREPEGMWNLLSIVREMYRRCDRNAIRLLEIITEECMACDQILIWWFYTKLSLLVGSNGHSGGKHSNTHSNSNASQHACSSLCDEIVVLWRLAALNPGLAPDERDMLHAQFTAWHLKILDRVVKCRMQPSSYNSKNQQNVRNDAELFIGFKPAIEACYLDWEDYPIAGVTHTQDTNPMYHSPFTYFKHTDSKSDVNSQVSSTQAVMANNKHYNYISTDHNHQLKNRYERPSFRERCYVSSSNNSSNSSSDSVNLRLQPHSLAAISRETRDDGNRSSVSSEGFCENDDFGGESSGNGGGGNDVTIDEGRSIITLSSPISLELPSQSVITTTQHHRQAQPTTTITIVDAKEQKSTESESSLSSSSDSQGSVSNNTNISKDRREVKEDAVVTRRHRDRRQNENDKKDNINHTNSNSFNFSIDENLSNLRVIRNSCNLDNTTINSSDRTTSSIVTETETTTYNDVLLKLEKQSTLKKQDSKFLSNTVGNTNSNNLDKTNEQSANSGSVGCRDGGQEFLSSSSSFSSPSSVTGSTTSTIEPKSRSSPLNPVHVAIVTASVASIDCQHPATSSKIVDVAIDGNACNTSNVVRTSATKNLQYHHHHHHHHHRRRSSKDESFSSSGDEFNFTNYGSNTNVSGNTSTFNSATVDTTGPNKRQVFHHHPYHATTSTSRSSSSGPAPSSSNTKQQIFSNLRPSEDAWDILLARAEGLHAHGHGREACILAVRLAEEMLANPPNLMVELPPPPRRKGKKPSINPISHQLSVLASGTLAKCAFLCTVLAENSEHYQLAFRICLFGLEMPRPPASTKPLEVKLANQEADLLALLKKIPLGQAELKIIREKAEQLKDGTLKSRGEALLPIMLASFIFDALLMPSVSGRETRNKVMNMSYRTPTDENLGFEAAVAALGLKANVSEAEHPLLCEGTRRQRGDLALTLLYYYKDEPRKIAKIMEKLLDRDIHVLLKTLLLPAYYSNNPPVRTPAVQARREEQEAIAGSGNGNAHYHQYANAEMFTSDFGGNSRPHSSTSAELDVGIGSLSISSQGNISSTTTAQSLPTSSLTGTATRSKDGRYKGKRAYPSIPNQPSEASAHFMFELAKNVLTKAGGTSSTSLFTQATTNQNHHGPHRALHMCAFQLGLYALGLHNCVSPNWLSRTYSSHVSWIIGQAMEIGAPAISFLIDTWEGHLTPPEAAGMADRASRGWDNNMIYPAAELALSVLPHAAALNPNEIQRAILQCKEQSDQMLERACITVESAAKGGGVYPEVLFQVARYWYELYIRNTPNSEHEHDVNDPDMNALIDSQDQSQPIVAPPPAVNQQVVVTTAPPPFQQAVTTLAPIGIAPYPPYSFCQGIYHHHNITYPANQMQMYISAAPPQAYQTYSSTPQPPPQQGTPTASYVSSGSFSGAIPPRAQVTPVHSQVAPPPPPHAQVPPQAYQPMSCSAAVNSAQPQSFQSMQCNANSSAQQQQYQSLQCAPPNSVQPQSYQQIPCAGNPAATAQSYSSVQIPVQTVQALQVNSSQIQQNMQYYNHSMAITPPASQNTIRSQPNHHGIVYPFLQQQPTVRQRHPHQYSQTQLRYLLAAYNVGMLAMETLARRVHDDRPQAKYARNPPYGEDVKWLLRISKKLGTQYLHQFCVCAVNSIVSPFVLHDVAIESAHYLGRNNPTLVMQHLRSALAPLVQKCQQMYIQCIHQKLYHLTQSDYEDFASIILAARAAFQITPEGNTQFKDWLQSIKRSKSCKKDLWTQINAALQNNSK